MSQEEVEVVRRSFEVFNARDIDGLLRLCAEDCVWLPFRAQLEGMAYRGHEGVRDFLSDMDEDWDSFRVDPLEFHDRRGRVAVVGGVSALGRGSGVEIDSVAGFVLELTGGRITNVRSYSDPDAALEALGQAE